MTAFSRFHSVMAAVATMLAGTSANMGRAAALDAVGGYESHGKGGRKARKATGVAKIKRAAKKAANIQRHKNHCRG